MDFFCFQGVGPHHLVVEPRDGWTITEIRQAVITAVCETPITENIHLLFPIDCICSADIVGYDCCLSYPDTMGEVFACWGLSVRVDGIFYYDCPQNILLSIEEAKPITHIVHRGHCNVVIPEYVDFDPNDRYISFQYSKI